MCPHVVYIVKIEDSYKFNGSGANTMILGSIAKQDLERIVQYDAQHTEVYHWGEVSGAIEHWMKKHGGSPIPNIYAHELLPNPNSIVSLDKDKFHYVRRIGEDQDEITKCIFGFKDDSLIQRLYEYCMKGFESYTDFKDYANKLPTPKNESLELDEGYKLRKWAIAIISTVYEYNEYGLNEMPEPMYELFMQAYKSLSNDNQIDPEVKTYIEDAEYLIEYMPKLEFNTSEFIL